VIRRLFHPLDRYVFAEFTKIFVATALGFPILVTVIDLVDNLDRYLSRNLPKGDIALSYVYALPEAMYLVLPAAVLFATIFTIGALTRHSEITAAKASGISFYRVATPIFFASMLAGGLAMVLSELAPIGNRRVVELRKEATFAVGTERYNFAFGAAEGRVYKIQQLQVASGTVEAIQIERRGLEGDSTYPTWIATADRARWQRENSGWVLQSGTLHVLTGQLPNLSIKFDSLRDRHFSETPQQLMASPKAPKDMRYRELGRYIRALERSGSDVNTIKVDRALKIAVPITCIIIALFGAPLATSTQRGGAAWGIGLSLGVTVTFLISIQLTKAIGGEGVLNPDLAAWIPNTLFALGGVVLLARVRT
jgi:lipopolysaccharide export system permease protein